MAEGPPGIHPLSAPPSLLRRLLSRSRRQLVLGALAVVLVAAVVTGVALAATTAAGNGPVYVRGAVAADVGLCSEMGVDVMRQGGNAVDAAITTTLCVGLVNAQSSGIGGGGFMVVYNATTGVGTTIDFRETAPAAATQDMYTSSPACLAGGDADRCPSRFGGLSVAVPAELRGLEKAWQMFGRLPWSQLVTPVADLAESGFEVSAYTAESVAGRCVCVSHQAWAPLLPSRRCLRLSVLRALKLCSCPRRMHPAWTSSKRPPARRWPTFSFRAARLCARAPP